MFVLYGAKAKHAKGKILSAKLFGLKYIGQVKIGL